MSNGGRGLNREERKRSRAALRASRNDLRRARRSASRDDKPPINVRLKLNEVELARIDLAALKDRDDDPDVLEQLNRIEHATRALKDETDAFERAAGAARKVASVIRKADDVLKFAANLTALVV